MTDVAAEQPTPAPDLTIPGPPRLDAVDTLVDAYAEAIEAGASHEDALAAAKTAAADKLVETGTELAVVEGDGRLERVEDALAVLPDPGEWMQLCTMARTLAIATSAPDAVRGKPADMLLVLLTARDLGIRLTDALRTVQVVKGHVTLAPRLKIALIESKGMGWIRPCVVDPRIGACPICGDPTGNTTDKATAHAWRAADDMMASYTFTIADAVRAKIIKDDGAWKTYPQRMLWWRASGYMADDLFPNAAIGIYSPDEMGALTDEEGNFIDVTTVEPVPGFAPPPPPPAEMPTDEERDGIAARIAWLPDEAKDVLRELWQAKLRPLGEITKLQMRTANALVTSIEKRAAKGEWGEWEPEPQEEAPGRPDAAESAPPADDGGSDQETAPDAVAATEPDPEPVAEGPTPEQFDAVVAEVAAMARREVVTALGAAGLPTGGAEPVQRQRLAGHRLRIDITSLG